MQPLLGAQFGRWDRLQVQPTLSPEPGCVYRDLQFTSDLSIALACGCRQHDAGSQRDLLFSAMALDQFLKFLPFGICQMHGSRFRT